MTCVCVFRITRQIYFPFSESNKWERARCPQAHLLATDVQLVRHPRAHLANYPHHIAAVYQYANTILCQSSGHGFHSSSQSVPQQLHHRHWKVNYYKMHVRILFLIQNLILQALLPVCRCGANIHQGRWLFQIPDLVYFSGICSFPSSNHAW